MTPEAPGEGYGGDDDMPMSGDASWICRDIKVRIAPNNEVPDLVGLWRRVWSSGSAGAEVRLRIERDGDAMRVSMRSADRTSFLKSPRLH